MLDTLKDWLCFLENRHQKEVQLGLERMHFIATRLDLLNLDAVVISIAGTNGKGTTVAALEAIYQTAGYRTASYTSPHLIQFNERIKINREPVSDETLIDAFQIIEASCSDEKPTYFEMATLAALFLFKQQPLDLIFLEVGMGGRLDATNVVANQLSIITTIDLDHQDFLGTTREEIAFEKAGIIKSESNVIFADEDMPSTISSEAYKKEASLHCLGKAYYWDCPDKQLRIKTPHFEIHIPRTSLHPNSLAAAVMACDLLINIKPISADKIQEGLLSTKILCRMQIFEHNGIKTILDVAHNPQSVAYLAHVLNNNTHKKVYAVFSALKDKDVFNMVLPLKTKVSEWHLVALDSKRALSEDEFRTIMSLAEINVSSYQETALAAYQFACRKAGEGDLVLVFGSFLTVSEVLSHLVKLSPTPRDLFSGASDFATKQDRWIPRTSRGT